MRIGTRGGAGHVPGDRGCGSARSAARRFCSDISPRGAARLSVRPGTCVWEGAGIAARRARGAQPRGQRAPPGNPRPPRAPRSGSSAAPRASRLALRAAELCRLPAASARVCRPLPRRRAAGSGRRSFPGMVVALHQGYLCSQCARSARPEGAEPGRRGAGVPAAGLRGPGRAWRGTPAAPGLEGNPARPSAERDGGSSRPRQLFL